MKYHDERATRRHRQPPSLAGAAHTTAAKARRKGGNQMYEDLDQLVPIKKRLRIYSGTSNPKLAADIAKILGVEVDGLVLEQFANGEIYARFDETVRGCDVFFVQSIVGKNVNDLMMETLIVADAAHRASARSVTAVIPHYAYARQDRKAGPREPITGTVSSPTCSRRPAWTASPRSTCTRARSRASSTSP